MRGHTRPLSIRQASALRARRERATWVARHRGEIEAVLSERGYRLTAFSFSAERGTEEVEFCAVDDPNSAYSASGPGLARTLQVYPRRIPVGRGSLIGTRFANDMLITKAFVTSARRAFEGLRDFRAPALA